jgi:hypothetical protein
VFYTPKILITAFYKQKSRAKIKRFQVVVFRIFFKKACPAHNVSPTPAGDNAPDMQNLYSANIPLMVVLL